jgi:hypothetical protein
MSTDAPQQLSATWQPGAVSAETVDVEKLRKDLDALNDTLKFGQSQQEEKDKAQDELLAMEFNLLKQELGNYVKGTESEDQKKFILTKIAAVGSKLQVVELQTQGLADELHSLPSEMREEIRSLITATSNELMENAQKLKEQMEKVSEAVLAQVKMVDQRLADNSEEDERFQEFVKSRLGVVERMLGISEDGQVSEDRLRQLLGGDGAVHAKVQQLDKDVTGLQESHRSVVERVDEQERSLSDLMSKDNIPIPEKVDNCIERINTLEERVDEVQGRKGSPLDWLEARVHALAESDYQAQQQRVKDLPNRFAELTIRVEALESLAEAAQQQNHAAENAQVQCLTDPEVPVYEEVAVEQEVAEGTAGENDGIAPPASAASKRSARSPISPLLSAQSNSFMDGVEEVSQVKLFEDMERLRRIVECMESTMPLDVRQNISFFKSRFNAGDNIAVSQSTSRDLWTASSDLETQVLELKQEAGGVGVRITKCEQLVSRENSNLSKAMRGMERELDRVRVRVDELWAQLPQLVAILAPLQIHLQDASPGQNALELEPSVQPPVLNVRTQTPVEALKPLSKLIEATLQKCINELREDLLTSFDDVKGSLGTKANEVQVEGRQLHDKVTHLQDQVEKWARSPLRGKTPASRWIAPGAAIAFRSTLAGREKATHAAMNGAEVPGNCHAHCKKTSSPEATRPMSKSTGRLPVLSKS